MNLKFIIFDILLIILSAAVSTYASGQNNRISAHSLLISVTPVPTLTQTMHKSVVYTPSGWKLYVASDSAQRLGYKYSLRYPENWSVEESMIDSSTINLQDMLSPQKVSKNVSIMQNRSCITITIGNYSSLQQAVDEISRDGKVLNSVPSSVGDIMGIQQTVQKAHDPVPYYRVFVDGGLNRFFGQNRDSIYIIESCPLTDQNTFNQVLQTFNINQ